MNAAFIPVRGGSKSIPLKNIKPMCGKPLVYWTAAAACKSKKTDIVYVCTDSDEIRRTVEEFRLQDPVFSKLHVIGRSAQSATDTASTESAMLEFANKYESDTIVLIQATSPLLTAEEIDRGFALYETEHTDSVLSAVPQKRFHWVTGPDGCAVPENYDVFRRPRRQEMDAYYVENGAFYITSRKALLETKNRLSGNIKICPVSEESFLEIDEPGDWLIIEQLLEQRLRQADRQNRQTIRMFLTDSDGCLTDGGMYYSEHGDELKKFNTLDGMGFRLLKERGILCGIVTGEDVSMVKRRADKLKLDIVETGIQNKLETVKKLCEKYQVAMSQVAYMGDDINDLEVIQNAGLSFTVPGSVEIVQKYADIITKRKGGDGAVREAIDYILSAASSSGTLPEDMKALEIGIRN